MPDGPDATLFSPNVWPDEDPERGLPAHLVPVAPDDRGGAARPIPHRPAHRLRHADVAGPPAGIRRPVYKIPRVVVGENTHVEASEALLRSHGVEVVVLDDDETTSTFRTWMDANPALWNEDIGEEGPG